MSLQERPRSISFEMTYNEKNVTVMVLPGDGDLYGVFINFKFVSILQRDDHGRWHDKSKEIDDSYVELIGLKIDSDL